MNDVDVTIAKIKRHGWWRGAMDTRGGTCLALALENEGRSEWVAAVRIIREQWPDRLLKDHPKASDRTPLGILMRFNDHPHTTLDDLDLVAEKVRAQLAEWV